MNLRSMEAFLLSNGMHFPTTNFMSDHHAACIFVFFMFPYFECLFGDCWPASPGSTIKHLEHSTLLIVTVQTVPTSPRRAALRDPQAANRRRSFGDGIVAHRGNRQARRMGEFWFIAPGHGPYGNAISVAMRSLRFTGQKKVGTLWNFCVFLASNGKQSCGRRHSRGL